MGEIKIFLIINVRMVQFRVVCWCSRSRTGKNVAEIDKYEFGRMWKVRAGCHGEAVRIDPEVVPGGAGEGG